VTRVNVVIFYPRAAPGAGPLTGAFATIRGRNVDRQAIGFERAGAEVRVLADIDNDLSFGQHVRETVEALAPDGLVLLGSGSIPVATASDRRAFVETAAGPPGHALANNRYSADIVAVAGAARLADLPDLRADNGLPRWLSETAGFEVADLHRRWRLQVDLDTPLDALLVPWLDAEDTLRAHDVATSVVRTTLATVAAAGRDPRRELIVAGRASAANLAWLERSTLSRTRALVEERGFRTRVDGQRPVRSTLGLLLDHDGPGALGAILAKLGDAALVDSRVLLAHRFGADESSWPGAEDRFASDLLLPERIADPWLRELTEAAIDAPIPIVLGGHTLVGPGLRLALAEGRAWT
jgi:hypothetical protein